MSERDPGLFYQIPGADNGEMLVFQDGREVIEIDKEHADIVWSALSKADGYRTKQQISDELVEGGYDEESADNVLDDLMSLGIIGPSTEQYKRFHQFTENPAIYDTGLSSAEVREITEKPYPAPGTGEKFSLPTKPGIVAELSKERYSNRAFEQEPIELNELGEILSSTMSMDRTPIPSAGGLYGLRVYAFIKPGHEIPEGSYQYDPVDNDLVLIEDEYDEAELAYALNQEDTLHDAPAIVVLAADLSRHSEKYGDRGYRYVHLEAGHAAQNVHLTAAELGLASLEYGGFGDDEIAKLLRLEENETPLIALAVGKAAEEEKRPSYLLMAELEDYYVGEDKPIDYVRIDAFNQDEADAKFYSATAHYKAPNEAYSKERDQKYAAGTARSMTMAAVKAVAEAYERYASGMIRADQKASAMDLQAKWLDPRTIRPLSDEQLEHMHGLTEFEESMEIDWVEGEAGGEKIMVPVELAFYPHNQHIAGRKLVAESDSSGVAAFTDEETAIERGLLELIERDALMRNWFSRQSPDRLSPDLLPAHVQKRLEYWKERGYDLHVLDMSDETAVIQSVLVNREESYPYFVNGASASLDYESSINKSLEEAELGLLHALNNEPHGEIEAHSVWTPSDHAHFYHLPENARHISWLWSGNIKDSLKSIDKNIDLVGKYTPITVKLNPSEEPLSVVRVIAPSLVPINFGTGNEYYTHPYSGVERKPEHIGNAPHYFA